MNSAAEHARERNKFTAHILLFVGPVNITMINDGDTDWFYFFK